VPIYEYKCRKCSVKTNITRGFNDTDTPACSTCNLDLTRVYSSIGVSFNGSGFYSTDKKV
jgi:putative FmdB family regulatory protein